MVMTESVRQWLCKRLCGSTFFDADASLEIDRLTVLTERQGHEIKALRAQLDWLKQGGGDEW